VIWLKVSDKFVVGLFRFLCSVFLDDDGQYKQVTLRHQAMLVTRGPLYRFGRVSEIGDKEKDKITIDN